MTFQNVPQSLNKKQLADWRDIVAPSIDTLRQMAGTTEDEFLQIGSRLQSFYQRSVDISGLARQLVSMVSGENGTFLIVRLQQIMSDMEDYLTNARIRSGESVGILEGVQTLLDELSEPLDRFQKMDKTLRMLSISTKIESARLGEVGSGFVNLASDVEKLSQQVNEKSAAILSHRHALVNVISESLSSVQSTEAQQDNTVTSILGETAANLQALVTMNERCTQFGSSVEAVSVEIAANISDVVSSMQMHDMTRQQLEHVVEAFERLLGELADSGDSDLAEENSRRMIIEVGDVCELQEAQLRFASSELYSAVCTIVDSLREVAHKQSTISQETHAVMGVTDDAAGTSFVDVMSQGMTAVSAVLTSCLWADQEMSNTLKKVAQTIDEIAVFVTGIEEIGSEIDLIALNSQVKAALTGPEGAALGVLAEAIKRLSDEAVQQTSTVVMTLAGIHSVTSYMLDDSRQDEKQLDTRIIAMQDELGNVLRMTGKMNTEMRSVMSELNEQVLSITRDVEQTVSGVDVHERTKVMADTVLVELQQIVDQSRRIEPASNEFKENLRHMEERYTMESERHIHEALARKRSGQSVVVVESVVQGSAEESEFGDNVDLF